MLPAQPQQTMSPALLDKALDILRDRYSLQNYDEMKQRVAASAGQPGQDPTASMPPPDGAPMPPHGQDGAMPMPPMPGAAMAADPGAAPPSGLPPGVEPPPQMSPDQFKARLGRHSAPKGASTHLGNMKGGPSPQQGHSAPPAAASHKGKAPHKPA